MGEEVVVAPEMEVDEVEMDEGEVDAVEVNGEVESVVTVATPPQAAASKVNPNKPNSAFFITIPYAAASPRVRSMFNMADIRGC